ncbi:hypothetical protein AQUCO_01400279v1 [Aquilegia coerulea]|uniref:Uncharacterized protein n=1 Tax=Aquilegia coerulea TaxID=218851 RepID=A0A2G5DVK4_AQUCA|nr:hypothetical protein AQUCO_01400279v1 [Aquilegia coerulea]
MTALTEISHPITSTGRIDHQQVLAEKNAPSKDCDEIAQNVLNCRGDHGGRRVEFEEGSDVASPPLWKTGPQTMITRLRPRSYFNHQHHRYQAVSSKRSQEIARDREKLMELIQNMPEDCYELSLKDIVENPIVQGVEQTTVVEERTEKSNDHAIHSMLKTEKASGRNNNLIRSGSMSEGQVFLKLFSPISLGIKKSSRLRPCAKVLPRAQLVEEEKCVDRGWWKKRFLIHGENKSNDSGTIVKSSSCNSSSGRAVIDLLPGCWSFFYVKKWRRVGQNKITS